ncbi:hypothetical protein ZWY2020_003163 [Hordeum vulgare]|nr:hypothetical protein ZWY2020_003163 [Hordeum vulgare]
MSTTSTLSAATSSTQTNEEQKRKRYRPDDSIAPMLGERLDNFTSAYKDDIARAAPPVKPSSLDEILPLNAIAILMNKKWILKKIKQ